MIDTIKFLIPIDDISIIEKLKGTLSRFRKENLKEGKLEFEFFVANIKLGSYNRTIAIKSTEIPTGFFVEFSVPKYEKGNNIEMVYPHELTPIIEKLYKEICNHMEYKLPHFSNWPIYRLDVCYNWIFKNEEETLYLIDVVKRIDFPRKQKYVWNTSIMYKGTAYSVKFYLKGAEFKKNDFKKIETSKAVILQEWANRILRFEVGLRKKYLQDFFGLDKVYLKDITDDSLIIEILNFYLKEKIFFYMNQKTMNNAKVEEILFDNFTKSKATRLYQFYRGYYFDDELKSMYLRGGMNRSTIYRYKKDLKNVGVGMSIENISFKKGLLEQLVIPSENSKFDLNSLSIL